jgi:hypothetical protein
VPDYQAGIGTDPPRHWVLGVAADLVVGEVALTWVRTFHKNLLATAFPKGANQLIRASRRARAAQRRLGTLRSADVASNGSHFRHRLLWAQAAVMQRMWRNRETVDLRTSAAPRGSYAPTEATNAIS